MFFFASLYLLSLWIAKFIGLLLLLQCYSGGGAVVTDSNSWLQTKMLFVIGSFRDIALIKSLTILPYIIFHITMWFPGIIYWIVLLRCAPQQNGNEVAQSNITSFVNLKTTQFNVFKVHQHQCLTCCNSYLIHYSYLIH